MVAGVSNGLQKGDVGGRVKWWAGATGYVSNDGMGGGGDERDMMGGKGQLMLL